MAPARLQFDMSLRPSGSAARRRGDGEPMRLLLLADLGGDRQTPPSSRKALALDIDTLDKVLARIAPRLSLNIDGQALALSFASLEDFHPDALFKRLPVFGALRQMREEARDSTQFRRVAAALGASPAAAPPAAAAMAPPAAADAASDIERLLGRAPSAAATPATTSANADTAAAAGSAAALDRWLRDLVAPHTQPDTAHEQRALVEAIDTALTGLMRQVLHEPGFQALEAAWLGADRLVRGLELGESLQLFVFDISRAELLQDLAAHRDDLSGSVLHRIFSPGAGADGQRWSLLALDQAFGPEADEVQALAALGALAARAGAPLIASATPALAGASSRAELAEPRRWVGDDDEGLAYWQALRGAPMAPWIGLVLPRVLMRLPYGAATDPVSSFAFEEMPAERPHASYLWGGGAPALALLAGMACLQGDGDIDLSGALDLEDLPSHIYSADGERHQQAGAELLLSEEAGQALLERGLMPLLSWRQRNAARLLRWQSVASPAQALQGLGR
jgi:type VI secretion system protein ImpC